MFINNDRWKYQLIRCNNHFWFSMYFLPTNSSRLAHFWKMVFSTLTSLISDNEGMPILVVERIKLNFHMKFKDKLHFLGHMLAPFCTTHSINQFRDLCQHVNMIKIIFQIFMEYETGIGDYYRKQRLKILNKLPVTVTFRWNSV